MEQSELTVFPNPYFLKFISEDPDINNSVLGINQDVLFIFGNEDDAYCFQEKIVEMVSIKFFGAIT